MYLYVSKNQTRPNRYASKSVTSFTTLILSSYYKTTPTQNTANYHQRITTFSLMLGHMHVVFKEYCQRWQLYETYDGTSNNSLIRWPALPTETLSTSLQCHANGWRFASCGIDRWGNSLTSLSTFWEINNRGVSRTKGCLACLSFVTSLMNCKCHRELTDIAKFLMKMTMIHGQRQAQWLAYHNQH